MKIFKTILPVTMLLASIEASGSTFVTEQVNFKMEVWKEIKNSDYLISNYGNVRSLKRNIIMSNVLSPFGYLYVKLFFNKIPRKIFVHRLVAEAFCCNKYNKPFVNHIDSNKENNYYKNLEWVTQKENINHSHKKGISKQKGSNHHFSKLKEIDVLNIRIEYLNGSISHSELAKKYKVSKPVITKLLNRKTWKHI